MSKKKYDAVKFFLSSDRVASGGAKYANLFERTLYITLREFHEHAREQGRYGFNGVFIVCRPSQFSRYLVGRNDAGLTNGFKELEPKLIEDHKPAPAYDDTLGHIAKIAGISRESVKKVAEMFARENWVEFKRNIDPPVQEIVLDVSQRWAMPLVTPNYRVAFTGFDRSHGADATAYALRHVKPDPIV